MVKAIETERLAKTYGKTAASGTWIVGEKLAILMAQSHLRKAES